MRRLPVAAVAPLAFTVICGLAFPCGDKLMLLVAPARSRQVFGTRSASILAYARRDSPVKRVIEDIEMQNFIQRNGHRFFVVEDRTKLLEAVKVLKYDVMIADVSDMEILQPHLRLVLHRPMILLPIVYEASKEQARFAQKKFRHILKAPATPEHYLEALDGALGLRGSDDGSN